MDHASRTDAGRFLLKSSAYVWHAFCNTCRVKYSFFGERTMLELLFVIGFFVMLLVTGVSLLG
ncbi:envelope stress response protein PspG, partial [Mycobacterium tuberculosis]|nr:envelope stress response protein PspG [Mycobacterium tuberculosis]